MAVSHDNLSGAAHPHLGATTSAGRDVVRYGDDLDATLPPTPVRELLAASGATLCVLATDADFVAAIRRAAGDRYPLSVAESWNELKSAADSGRCGIALLDADLLGSRVAECVATLAVHADRLVTLVAADRAAAQEYLGLVANGRVHRLLIKPPAVGATRLLIESATARRLQLREAAANDDAAHGLVLEASGLPKWVWPAAAGAGAAALLATGIVGTWLEWWQWPPAPVTVTSPAVTAVLETTPTPTDEIAGHRARAALALQEGRLAEPVGDSAIDHYRAILAVAPADPAARDGVSAVVESLFARAEEALLADSLAAAAAALDQIRRTDPASSRLAFLDAQLARSLAAFAVPPAPSQAAAETPAAAPSELESAISLATARLRRGQLLSPAGDSARAYLDRAAALAQSDPRVAALRTDLAAALVASARLVADSDVAAATALAAEARRLGAAPRALAALEEEVGAARTLQEQRLTERLEIARERVVRGALFAPANDNALEQLSTLQADVPDLPQLAEVWEAFRNAGVLAIQRSIEAQDWAAVDVGLAGLSQAPGGAVAAGPLAAELAIRRQQQAYFATAAPASELRLQSSVPVVYPPDALNRELQGWVDLEFVVDGRGQPRDLSVVQASSPGTFDNAALAAVERYRYVPFERDGRVYERRVRLRVRFQIQ